MFSQDSKLKSLQQISSIDNKDFPKVSFSVKKNFKMCFGCDNKRLPDELQFFIFGSSLPRLPKTYRIGDWRSGFRLSEFLQ